MAKEKHLIVSEDTHQQIKDRAKEAGVTIDKYIRLCLAATKTDKAQ